MTDKENIRAYIEKLHKEHRGSEGDFIFRKALRTVLFYIDSMQEEPSETKSKCMYALNDFNDEDRKILCDGCEEECKYNKKETVSEIDFEQELYKAFGHVKDFTLGMQIAKRFYEIGKQHQEPVSEDLEEAAVDYGNRSAFTDVDPFNWILEIAFKDGANWQKQKDSIPVSEDLGEYINELSKQFPEVSFAKLSRIAVRVAKWQKQQDQSTIELAEDHAMLAGMEKMKEQMLKNAITAEVRVVEDFMGTMTLRCFCDKYKQGDKVKIVIFKAE